MKHGQRKENKAILSVYVANLTEYLNGNYVGKWIDLPKAHEELVEDIKSILRNDEEYAIHDYESCIGLSLHEYTDIYRLNDLLHKVEIDRLNELGALIRCFGYTLDEAINSVESTNYLYLDDNTFISDEENLAYTFIEELGGIREAVGNKMDYYFDYESFGRDLRYDLDSILEGMELNEEEEQFYKMSNIKLAEWYIYNCIGSVECLDKETKETYFDYESFGRDLSFDYEIDHATMIAVSIY